MARATMETVNRSKRMQDQFGENNYMLKKKHKKGDKQKEIRKIGFKKKHKNWIAGAIKHPGALRRTAGVKGNKKIPAGKLASMAKEKGTTGKRARLAQTLRSFHHKR